MIPLWLVMPIAVLGGAVATGLGIPAGAMIGALVAVAAANLLSGRSSRVPPKLVFAGRGLLGTVIGSAINRQTLELLGNAILPTFILSIGLLASCVALGFITARLAKLDRATTLCSLMPGGMGEMTSIASDLGADVRVVAALHVLRLIVILLVVPLAVIVLVGPR